MSARPDAKTQIAKERQAYYEAIRTLHLSPAVGAVACAGAAAAEHAVRGRALAV